MVTIMVTFTNAAASQQSIQLQSQDTKHFAGDGPTPSKCPDNSKAVQEEFVPESTTSS